MTPHEMIEKSRTEGARVTVTGDGQVRLLGPASVVARWAPIIAENKPAIIAALTGAGTMSDAEYRHATLNVAVEVGMLLPDLDPDTVAIARDLSACLRDPDNGDAVIRLALTTSDVYHRRVAPTMAATLAA
jgi:hypothetical protein